MTPRKFVKRPVVIEAHQLGNDYDDDCAAIGWCGGRAVGEEEEVGRGGMPQVESAAGAHHRRERNEHQPPGPAT